jgi:hypothetical protein
LKAPSGAPDTMWGPHMYAHIHVFMSGLSGGPAWEGFLRPIGQDSVGGIEQPVGAAALLHPLDASMMRGMHMHHP